MLKRLVAVLFLATALGCASDNAGVREKEGVRYGVTQGVFRGRWWSYYERGTSYLAGQFYEEARADFERAIQGYTRDTWRARTYGLHFVEYFPNRELGVACYHLGLLDDAERHLSNSLAEVDTERAHHYLDLVTRQRIAQGLVQDGQDPTLEGAVPANLVSERLVPVQVVARDDVGVASVTVNGKQMYQRGSAGECAFSEDLLMIEGRQQVTLESTDLADKKTVQEVTVTIDLTGPTIGLFSPADAAVTTAAAIAVNGVAVDANGVASVAVNGAPAAESQGAGRLEFSTETALTEGENTLVITARDLAGNETRTALKVFRGAPASPSARLWQWQQRQPGMLALAGPADGAVQMLLSATPEEIPGINVKSPDPERPYRHNRTLRVSGDVVVTTKLASLNINGEAIGELTGAPRESFNKRIPIDTDAAADQPVKVPVSIVAQDDTGATLTREFEVEVRPVMLDTRESRMPVAVLAFAGNGVEPATSELLRVSTENQMVNGGRFRIVDRTRLQDVLTEQQLSAALGDPNQALELGKMTPAQIFLVADIFPRDQQGLEIKARAISTETSDVIATLDTFIDDKNDTGKVDAGCAAIVEQLAALYPRLSGELLAVRGGDELLVNWTPEDGVREGAYVLVVKEEEPWVDEDTGEVLAPGEFVEVGRAKVQSVQNAGTRARTVETTQEGVQLEKGMPAITM